MSIDYYMGTSGPTIQVETPDDLAEALDILHTQVMDAFGDRESAPYLDILEKAMEALETLEPKP